MDMDDLQFKDSCEGCDRHISWVDTAFICELECTWCLDCADGRGMVCPNCSSQLRKRPRRTKPAGR